MKKINKLSLVLASALVIGAITGCGQSTGYIEQVGSVSDFKVKAYPGANYLTWAPSEVSYGYAIFRDGEYVTSVGNTQTSYWDYIDPDYEWSDGQEVKYTIQNAGRDAARNVFADTVIGSSAFAEATVKAINPGYKSEVMYKIPALEEGKALPNFADFDYTNAEELAKLVEPTATITEREDKDSLISMATVPYLNTRIWVTNEDETEKMSFEFNSGDTTPKPITFSKLGNATVPTAFIGKNVIWAEFSDLNSYYESKKVILGEFVKEASEYMDFGYNNSISMTYDSEAESYKIEWKAPVNKLSGNYVTDCTYALYYQPDYWTWEKVVLTPVYDEIAGTYESLVDIPLLASDRAFRFFAIDSEGKAVSPDGRTTYYEGRTPKYWENFSFGSWQLNIAVTDKAKDGAATKIALVWDPAKYYGEVSDKITYQFTSSTYDPLTDEWSDPVAFDATINAYDEKTGKMTTASFDAPKNKTIYSIIVYLDGKIAAENVTATYNASNTYDWGSGSLVRDGKTVEVNVLSSTEAKSPVTNSYVVYYMPSYYNEDTLNLAVAKKVECSVKDWEVIVNDATRKAGTFEFDLDDKDKDYKVWIFEVNGDAFDRIIAENI